MRGWGEKHPKISEDPTLRDFCIDLLDSNKSSLEISLKLSLAEPPPYRADHTATCRLSLAYKYRQWLTLGLFSTQASGELTTTTFYQWQDWP